MKQRTLSHTIYLKKCPFHLYDRDHSVSYQNIIFQLGHVSRRIPQIFMTSKNNLALSPLSTIIIFAQRTNSIDMQPWWALSPWLLYLTLRWWLIKLWLWPNSRTWKLDSTTQISSWLSMWMLPWLLCLIFDRNLMLAMKSL